MDITDKLRDQIKTNPVILYMKGTRSTPQCGFSAQAVDILTQADAAFETVDVLSEPDVRAQLPLVSSWPTFPQLYINGELIGGSDIMVAHFESGELQRLIAKAV